MFLSFIFFSLFNISQAETLNLGELCQARRGNCEFYQCAEEFYNCRSQGYFKKFAIPYCEQYFHKTSTKLSRNGQRWLKSVAYCLQHNLERRLDETWSCKRIQKYAVANHSYCYVKTGFCKLSTKDQSQVLQIIFQDLWRPELFWEGVQILHACQKK